MADGATSLALLPGTIDTPGNRAAMPDADTSEWTPVSEIADKVLEWASDKDSRPKSGTLVSIITESGETRFEY